MIAEQSLIVFATSIALKRLLTLSSVLMCLLFASKLPKMSNTETFASAVAGNVHGVHVANGTGEDSCTCLTLKMWNMKLGHRRTRLARVRPMKFAMLHECHGVVADLQWSMGSNDLWSTNFQQLAPYSDNIQLIFFIKIFFVQLAANLINP